MGRLYSAYGLILSLNQPVQGLVELAGPAAIDLQILLGEKPPFLPTTSVVTHEPFYISPDLDDVGRPSISIWKAHGGELFRILYDDGTEFFVDRAGTQVWATWPAPLTLEDTGVFLRGPILGFVLRLRGVTPLHASAIEIDGRAVAFLGPAGSGKSTTAAAFAQAGFPVLSDDIVPLEERADSFWARPGYPCVCLWPRSAEALYGSAEALPLLTPNWTKRYLPVEKHGYRFREEPLPLGAIYLLGDRCGESHAPSVGPMEPQAALIALVSNAYMNYLLDSGMRVTEFRLLGHLAAGVPMRKLHATADISRLDDLRGLILGDFQELVSAALANFSSGAGDTGL